jgi:hypothetical protein
VRFSREHPAAVNRLPALKSIAGLTLLAWCGPAGAAEPPPAPPPAGPPWPCHVIDNTGRGSDGTKLGDINRDGLPDVTTGWEEDGSTRVYLNPGPRAAKSPWPRVIVGATPSAEDAVFADLDGDGHLDVVSCTEGSSQQVYVHWAPGASALLDPAAWKQDVFPAVARVTRWMFAEPLQIDGRNGIDLVIGGKSAGQNARSALGWLEAPPRPREVAAWKWHPLIETGWIMSIELEDMDGDGDADILYSDRYGATRGVFWLENPGPARAADPSAWRKHRVGATDANQIMFLASGDVDGDGRRDIAAGIEVEQKSSAHPARHSRILWFRRLDASGRRWEENLIGVPSNTGNIKGLAIGDMDGDGRMDFVVSCESASNGRIGVYWLQQYGPRAPAEMKWSAHNIAGPRGIKYDVVRLLDLDGDGDLDVLTNDEQEGKVGLGVVWYENPRLPAQTGR